MWIGYNDKDNEGDWIWTDRMTSSYTNWNDKSPNNGGISCAIVTRTGKWHDEPCQSKYSYICKKPSKSTIFAPTKDAASHTTSQNVEMSSTFATSRATNPPCAGNVARLVTRCDLVLATSQETLHEKSHSSVQVCCCIQHTKAVPTSNRYLLSVCQLMAITH